MNLVNGTAYMRSNDVQIFSFLPKEKGENNSDKKKKHRND
jgi:hypothetical protein